MWVCTLGGLANQTGFTFTGPDIDAVAFQYATPGEGSETVMVTVVAPTSAEAEEVVRALTGTEPPS